MITRSNGLTSSTKEILAQKEESAQVNDRVVPVRRLRLEQLEERIAPTSNLNSRKFN
jgi:hypothetical protein